VNYLYKTVNRSVCDASNVGCRMYSANMEKTSDLWHWKLINYGASNQYKNHDNIRNVMFRLDKNIEANKCDQSQGGCTEFIRSVPGMATNLIPNSGFEELDDFW